MQWLNEVGENVLRADYDFFENIEVVTPCLFICLFVSSLYWVHIQRKI